VSALERVTDNERALAEVETLPAAEPAATAPADTPAPLLGWALLGLSGAYLLRALTESGAVSLLAGTAAGVLYAAWWLSLAARRAWEKPLASTIHSATAALIVAPLLWEVTVRFHLLGAWGATAILVAFVMFGLAIAWRKSIAGMAWIVTLTALITLFAIFRETQDARAWAAGVFLIAAAVEFSACRDHWLGLRWATAVNADFIVLALTAIVSRSNATEQSMALLSPWIVFAVQIAFPAIYLASTLDRTIYRKLPITGFEIWQAAAALLISGGGALYLAGATTLSRTAVGIFCLVFSVACYLIAFTLLSHEDQRRRNFHTYSAFALALMLSSCTLLLPAAAAPFVFAALSGVAVCAPAAFGRSMMRIQAVGFLAAAILTAEIIPDVTAQLIHATERTRQLPEPVWLATLAALALYYARNRAAGRVEAFVFATLALWLAASVVAACL
jgi:hypothetical protein